MFDPGSSPSASLADAAPSPNRPPCERPITIAISNLSPGSVTSPSPFYAPKGQFLSGPLDSANLLRFSEFDHFERLMSFSKKGLGNISRTGESLRFRNFAADKIFSSANSLWRGPNPPAPAGLNAVANFRHRFRQPFCSQIKGCRNVAFTSSSSRHRAKVRNFTSGVYRGWSIGASIITVWPIRYGRAVKRNDNRNRVCAKLRGSRLQSHHYAPLASNTDGRRASSSPKLCGRIP